MAAVKYDTLQIKVKSDSHAVTKADEIQIVDNLNRFFVGRGLYLADLFTKELVGWVTMRINSDFSPDIYDEQTHLRDQIDNLHENIAHRDGDLRSYEYRVDELAEGVNTFKANMERFHDQLVEEREAHVHEINQLKAQMFDMIAKSEQFELTKNWGTGGV